MGSPNPSAQFDVNFVIESVFPDHLPTGRVNCLSVHPEWFRDENLAHLPRLDFVLCETPRGVEAFRGLSVVYRDLAFTSPVKRIPGFAVTDPFAASPVGSERGEGHGGGRRGLVAPSRVAGAHGRPPRATL